jgi:hypothetical protein
MTEPVIFDLDIAPSGSGYAVRVLAAPSGEVPAQPITLPLDPSMLPARHTIAAWIRQARAVLRSESAELRLAREVGRRLFEAVFVGPVRDALAHSRAGLHREQRLRLRLRAPARLAQLPWELLHDGTEFLALSDDLALTRYLELRGGSLVSRPDRPLQIVVVLACPPGQRPLDLERELRLIEAAMQERIELGDAVLEVIRGPDTLGKLRRRLRSATPTHILHVLCHGDVDQRTRCGVLFFEDQIGDTHRVSAETLRLHIRRQRGRTRLVVLNACLGAFSGDDDPFGSVGAALVEAGVPMVIAMQFAIDEDAAARLAGTLYAELADGRPVDAALAEARLALYEQDTFRLDWAIPVLFARGENWTLLEPPEAVGRSARPALDPGDLRLARARGLATARRWDAALALFEELEASYTLPERLMLEAERVRGVAQVDRLRREAKDAEQRADWNAATSALEQLAALAAAESPEAAGLHTWLEHARAEQALAELAEAAAALAASQEWEVVLEVLIEIESRRPGYAHPLIDLAALRAQAQTGP